MNRNILIRIFISLALSFMTQQLYACKTVPTAKIVSPYTQYTCIGGSVSFDGKGSGTEGSYDGDNGDPHGGGNGIVTYYWNYSDDSDWHEDGGTPSHTFNGPADTYWVYLYVEDDEGVMSEDYDYCIVHVMKVEIDEPAPSEFPKYIGVDSSLTLKAKVTPSSATGGTFTWSKVTGPGSVTFFPNGGSTTSFSSNTVGSYTVKVQYTIGGVTCDSDSSGTIEVCNAKMVFKTGTPPIETSSLTRAESGTFEILNADGDPIPDATYSNWFFDGVVDVSDPSHTSSTWGRTIVQSGKASCTVTFDSTTCKVNKRIAALPRPGWTLTPTCEPDTNPNWGDYIGPVDTPFGINKDVGSETGWIIVPRGNDFEDGYTTAEVSIGCNKGVWYISASTFKSEHETWINKFTKPGTTGYPDPPNENLYEHNVSEGIDAAGHLQSVKNHEYYGTGTERNGHQAFLYDEEAKPGNDVKEEIEDNVAGSEADLKDITGAEVWAIDNVIKQAFSEEPTGNWFGIYYTYDFSLEAWGQAMSSH